MNNQDINTNISKAKFDVCVIGIGESGQKILDNLYKNKFDRTKYLLLTSDLNNQPILNKNVEIISIAQLNNNVNINNNLATFDVNVIESIKKFLLGSKILIITTSTSGNTSLSLIPLVCQVAKQMNILTISIVSTPYSFEGNKKRICSDNCLNNIKKYSDAYTVISNDKLLNNYPDITMIDAFQLTNNALKNCINTFIALNLKSSVVDIEFEEIFPLIKNKKEIYIGFGNGVGRYKISRSIESALNSKIIDCSIKKANNVIVNILSDPLVSMNQVNEIIDTFKKRLSNNEMNILFSFDVSAKLRNEVQINVIATFDNEEQLNEDQKTKEILVKIGNTLELELTGQKQVNSMSFYKDDIDDKENSLLSTKNEYIENNNTFIQFDEEDDDIPFFLK